jgi:hypothetical protein
LPRGKAPVATTIAAIIWSQRRGSDIRATTSGDRARGD